MASEFAYEDLSSFELEKYKFTWLRDEQLDGEAVFVVEQVPQDEFSGYSKSVVWIDQAEYRARKIEFYDRKNTLLKTLLLSNLLDECKLTRNVVWAQCATKTCVDSPKRVAKHLLDFWNASHPAVYVA